MRRLVLVLVLAGCASERSIMAPPEVLARMKANADTSHNSTLSELGGGCNSPFDVGGCGSRQYSRGCGSPRGGGRHAGGFAVLGAVGLVLRRRRA